MALTKTIKKMISDFGGPYEPSLGNPSVNGYVLASTTGGTRSWVEMASGGSMVYPSGTGIAVVSGGTSWGTTLTGTANYIPYWSTSSAMTSSADLQYASNVLTINNAVRSPSAASSSANGENLVVKAGSAWSGGSGTYGRLYLSPGNHTISIGSFADMFFGDDTYNGGGINLKVAGAETNIALAIQSKGTSSLSLGSGTNTLLGLYASSSIQIWTTNLLTFASAVDGIIKGANSSSAGRHLTVQGGAGGSTFNGGNLYLYGGVASGTGTRGDVYFGDGTNGYLPAKGSETNILYYDTATGKISYATAPTGTSYTFQHSLTESGGDVNLVNDSASPGNSKYYGTNASGTRGFFDLPSGGSMVYPSGTGIAVVSGGTSWGTTLTGTANYIPFWSDSSTLTSHANLQYASEVLTINHTVRSPSAANSGQNGTDLVIKAGDAWLGTTSSSYGLLYLSPGNVHTSGGLGGIIYLGDSTFNGGSVNFYALGTQTNIGLALVPKGNGIVLIGNKTTGSYVYLQSNYGIVIDVSFMTFGNSMEGVITGAGDSSAGRTLTLRGGEGGMGGGNHNGGNLYLYGGPKSGTGTRGNVHFGDGSAGYLPAKGSETNVVYYDPANGKISYGAPSGGSMVYPSGTGIAVVSGGTSWGTTLTGTANYIPFWSDSSTLTSHANLQYASGVLTINNTARAPSAANSGQSGIHLVIKAGDAWLGTSGSVGGKLYLSPGNIYEAGAAGSIIYLGDSTYNAANIQFIATGTQTNIDLGIYQKGTGAITIGDDTTAAYMWLKARYLVLMVSTHVTFGSAIDGVIKGGDNASSAGRTVTIRGGAGGSTFNGGNLYFYGGLASGTGTRGDVYFGDGTNGYLPAKGSETNVVYYNTSTGKLSYGAVSGGSYTFQHSLTESGGNVNLVNDSASPGNSKYYGTNVSGTKGFFDLPAGGSLSKATYTEVNTGTDNDKYVTPYAIKNSNVAYKPIQVTSVVLGVVNWAAGTNFYEIEYSNANIDANSIVEIIPSNSDLWIAEQAQILPEIISSSGKVTIFARQVPMDDIDVTVIIQQKST